MTSQPEKIFREKLENFQRPAPGGAWERIEAGLDKADKPALPWMKVAAALVILALAGYILWPNEGKENTPSLTKVDKAVPEKNNQKEDSEKTSPLIVQEQAPSQKNKKGNSKIKPVEKSEVAIAETEKNVSENSLVIEPIETTVAVVEGINPVQAPASKTIVYTAEEVNAKFLRKKSPTEATSEERKTSGMQKLMGLAYTLKNNEEGFGDLRQKKDEILALNFLNTEDKTEKGKN